MYSRYLSVGGVRFLRFPYPIEEFRVPYGSPTNGIDLPPDPIGVTPFRTVEIQPI